MARIEIPRAPIKTISNRYRSLNNALHGDSKTYGGSGYRWCDGVEQLCEWVNSRDVLDYGCGKGGLANALDFPIAQYDPAIVQYWEPPEPHDVVACIDVLEHVEPEYLTAVLSDLHRVMKLAGIFTIGLVPSRRILEDGRNAHLILESKEWWADRIGELFKIHLAVPLRVDGDGATQDIEAPTHLLVIVRPR